MAFLGPWWRNQAVESTGSGSSEHITGNLTVDGTSTLTGHVTAGAGLGVTGAVTVSTTLGVTGLSTLASLAVTGAATVGTTLGVTGVTTTSESININVAGKGLAVKTGANAKSGTVTANGTTGVAVATTALTANSAVMFGLKTVGGTTAPVYMDTVTPATGFTIKSSVGNTSVYNWVIVDLIP